MIAMSEKVETIYNCHMGYRAHGFKQSEGNFGSAVDVFDGEMVRVTVNDPHQVFLVRESEGIYRVSYKSENVYSKNIEEAARKAWEQGKDIQVSRFDSACL